MKIIYEGDKHNSTYRKILSINYCCNKTKAMINPKYITEELINSIVEKCSNCGEKIELKEVI